MLLAGFLLSLGFWTKTTDYIGVGLVGLAVVVRYLAAPETEARNPRLALQHLGLGLVPALLIGLPWWLRNIAIYGGTDFLGLQWHNLVAARGGQPTTAAWLASYGLPEVARRMAQTTFQSFWGQFGWMGVVLDARLYYAAALLTALALWGLLLCAVDWQRGRAALAPGTRASLALLAGLVVFTAAAYLWYNLTFVQHQGRYLFPALIPLGLGLAAGWRRALHGTWREAMGGVACTAVGGMAWYSLAGLSLRLWAVALFVAVAALVLLAGTPAARRAAWPARVLPFAITLGLTAMGLLALFGFVVPQLR